VRIGWLRPSAGQTGSTSVRNDGADDDPLDDVAALIKALRRHHDIELVNQQQAHDFVWRHARAPFDLVVHELADAPPHRFVVPYALHFPGALLLRGAAPQYARTVASSRWTIVGDRAAATALREQHPDAHVVHLPIGVDWPTEGGPAEGGPPEGGPYVRVALLTEPRRASVERAVARARESGARIELLPSGPAAERLMQADAILALEWPPPFGAPASAIAGMAARLPVVVFETLVTAGWPALDPQTWQPRGFLRDAAPIAISIDPRDEEHSLMLALRRLSADALLRRALGTAGHAWWQSHATVAHAASAWTSWLSEVSGSATAADHSRAHVEDGTEHARSVLELCGVQVDFLS
jgi:hypothetical protein